MTDDELLTVLYRATDAVHGALSTLTDWGPSGVRPGQYQLDLVADAVALEVLLDAGLGVLSEESGTTEGDRPLLAVLDPVDGSTNASQGIPFFSTSLCVLDEAGPRVAVVVNQATGVRYEAVRGGGARRDDQPIKPSARTSLGESIVAISGFPGTPPGWAQFRALGAASLELCAVADGQLDAYAVIGTSALYPWDYLGGLLVCEEVGAVVADRQGQPLVLRSATLRRPVAAGSTALLDTLLRAFP